MTQLRLPRRFFLNEMFCNIHCLNFARQKGIKFWSLISDEISRQLCKTLNAWDEVYFEFQQLGEIALYNICNKAEKWFFSIGKYCSCVNKLYCVLLVRIYFTPGTLLVPQWTNKSLKHSLRNIIHAFHTSLSFSAILWY